jgi:signal transduction histidine kinase
VVDLVADLNQAAPSQLAEAIGDALGDPRLRLLMWSPTQHAYLDADAHAVQPSAGPQRAVTYVERHGEPLAALLHDAALLEDEGTLRAVSAVVAITVENAQLTQELAARLREVAESRARLVAAADTERRRIERDLHDGAQQRLVTVALDLKLAETGLTDSVDEPMRRVLSRAVTDLGDALTELRSLARGIHPAILTESGLCAALESLVDRTAVPVALRADIPAGMPPMVEATAYFTVSEALANVAKHADASHVSVTADITDGMLRIAVIDDGRGGADSTGSGLLGIKDRVNAVGGTLRVHSPAGSGTRLEIELPCE